MSIPLTEHLDEINRGNARLFKIERELRENRREFRYVWEAVKVAEDRIHELEQRRVAAAPVPAPVPDPQDRKLAETVRRLGGQTQSLQATVNELRRSPGPEDRLGSLGGRSLVGAIGEIGSKVEAAEAMVQKLRQDTEADFNEKFRQMSDLIMRFAASLPKAVPAATGRTFQAPPSSGSSGPAPAPPTDSSSSRGSEQSYSHTSHQSGQSSSASSSSGFSSGATRVMTRQELEIVGLLDLRHRVNTENVAMPPASHPPSSNSTQEPLSGRSAGSAVSDASNHGNLNDVDPGAVLEELGVVTPPAPSSA